jgi:hypothetical protein
MSFARLRCEYNRRPATDHPVAEVPVQDNAPSTHTSSPRQYVSFAQRRRLIREGSAASAAGSTPPSPDHPVAEVPVQDIATGYVSFAQRRRLIRESSAASAAGSTPPSHTPIRPSLMTPAAHRQHKKALRVNALLRKRSVSPIRPSLETPATHSL